MVDLQSYLLVLGYRIDRYKYNTVKKREYVDKYNSLLGKIQRIDNVCEKMEKLSIEWRKEDQENLIAVNLR